MRIMFTIQFNYLDEMFSALVRVRERDRYKEYNITIMNASLNYWLYKNNVFLSENDQILEDQEYSAIKERVRLLRNKIRYALQEWLKDKQESDTLLNISSGGFQGGL